MSVANPGRRSQEKARQAEIASDRVARETAQSKTERAMEGVVNVQDRLIRALQNELETTDRAREAAQVLSDLCAPRNAAP